MARGTQDRVAGLVQAARGQAALTRPDLATPEPVTPAPTLPPVAGVAAPARQEAVEPPVPAREEVLEAVPPLSPAPAAAPAAEAPRARASRNVTHGRGAAGAGVNGSAPKNGAIAVGGEAPAQPAAAVPVTAATSPAPANTTAQRVWDLQTDRRKEAIAVFGIEVPKPVLEDPSPTVQLAFRVPKWLRYAVQTRCMRYDLTVQEFGRMAIEMLLEEFERAETREG